MKVSEILKAKGGEVMTVKPSETVETLAHRLRMARVGALVVSSDGQTLEGIVSERDMVQAIAEHGAPALSRTVADLMAHRVKTAKPDDLISAVAKIMTVHRIRHVPVVEAGRLVGIVSLGDVVKHRLDEIQLEADVLRDIAIAGG